MTRECDAWAGMMMMAMQLPDAELARHASVSIDNNHQCVSCFTCACAEVRRQRAQERRAPGGHKACMRTEA